MLIPAFGAVQSQQWGFCAYARSVTSLYNGTNSQWQMAQPKLIRQLQLSFLFPLLRDLRQFAYLHAGNYCSWRNKEKIKDHHLQPKVCDTTRQHNTTCTPVKEGFFLLRESSPPLLFDPGFSAILVSGIRTPS
ncbi:hypothetical protein FOYG_11228 [Fusarium oxysporum NRRL 32931]|uniref:Uncharacterized protein n=1 Tax=Fusarium oxysporum NRRL 32931 TaxID=660029 RepID=W9HX11_FUSOX|nr:hypothetical protein FOYG_11228 [Fusarium oxysporum NRRL 32931]EWY86867.1 hypothetical protein FOYG_11228 [Fusarium oxysporum NRRL 32931]